MHKPLFLFKGSKTPWNDGEREKGGVRVFPNDSLSGNGFHCAFSTSLPFLRLALLPLPLPRFLSLSRSVRGRRVWMWIELQIRSVLIMPLKGGLWEHLSLALSRNGRFPGSWSPPPHPPAPHQPPSPQLPAPPDQSELQPEPRSLEASFQCQQQSVFRNASCLCKKYKRFSFNFTDFSRIHESMEQLQGLHLNSLKNKLKVRQALDQFCFSTLKHLRFQLLENYLLLFLSTEYL